MNSTVQKQFEKFHENIKLNNLEHNDKLRDKRKLLVDALKEGLERIFKEKNEPAPKFESWNQGSYAMSTGICPTGDDDYDIDVAIFFHFSIEKYKPVEVKQWVYDALHTGNRTVEIKTPCVRVQYHKNGSEHFHVDLAIYSHKSYNKDNKTYIAKGKSGSKEENKKWEVSNPERLGEIFKEKFSDYGDRRQFRKVIRYLKRWKDINFASGNERPVGIAITACALNWFAVEKQYSFESDKHKYNDLVATRKLVKQILNQFKQTWHNDEWAERICVNLPVEPYNDLFIRMSNQHMRNLKTKFQKLHDTLVAAENETDPVTACEYLQKVFGEDFPLPEKTETAQQKAPAFVSSNKSA